MPTPRPAAPAQANISPGINRATPIMSDITPTARRYGPQNPQTQVTPSIHSTYRKTADNFETYERHRSFKGVGVILFTLAMSFGIWFYITEPDLPATLQTIEQKITGRGNPDATANSNAKPADPLLITNIKRVPADKNGALVSLFATTTNALKTTPEENDFLKKYVEKFSSKNLPPLAQTNTIVKKYSATIAGFDEALAKPYFQCIPLASDSCGFGAAQKASQLALLKAYLTFRKEGKADEAIAQALSIGLLGSKIAGNGDFTALTIGTSIQRDAYAFISYVKTSTPSSVKLTTLTAAEKNSLIQTLHQNAVTTYRYQYTGTVNSIRFVDDPQATTTFPIPSDVREELASLTTYKTPTNWLPEETIFYFLTSYQKAIENVKAPCDGPVPTSSAYNTGFKDNDPVESDNYIGKFLFSSSYPVFDQTLFTKRCELEKAINEL
jgi:hypothetical protein